MLGIQLNIDDFCTYNDYYSTDDSALKVVQLFSTPLLGTQGLIAKNV